MNRIETLAFVDIDRTMTPAFTLFPIYDALNKDRFVPDDANKTLQETLTLYEAGELPYSKFAIDALQAAALATAKKPECVIEAEVLEVVSKTLQLYSWVQPTFDELQRRNGLVTLVSAEPQFIASPIAEISGADTMLSSEFEVDDSGVLTGDVLQVLGSSQKGAVIQNMLATIQPSDVYVFGDSEGDIGMLDFATSPAHAFCITPDDELREYATVHGMTIIDDASGNQSLV